MAFNKGQSGNPGGRPKLDKRIQDLAREHTDTAISALAEVCKKGPPSARVAAAVAILDRAYGKPSQPTDQSGAMTVTVRVLYEDAPPLESAPRA